MAVPIMEDGFPTVIDFGQGTTFCVKTITPPSLEMGGANDVSCMSNTAYRTKAPKALIDMGDVQCVGYYSPELYTTFVSELGNNKQITITFPAIGSDAAKVLTVWGWLDSFAPGTSEEGSAPEATITIVISNRDTAGDEQAPVISDAA